jgi:hypothetical protein
MRAPYELACRAGRLVETRLASLKTEAEATAYCEDFRALALRQPGVIVVCADYRPSDVFSPLAVDALRALMVSLNARVFASAIVTRADHVTHGMQISRVVTETQHPMRRRFSDAREALAWYAEIGLSPAEHARAGAFLAAYAPAV